MSLAAALMIAGAVSITPTVRAQSLTPSQIAHRWGNSIVTIVTPDATGTGFFLSYGVLVTAYHVLKGSDTASIVFPDGRRGTITGALTADKSADLAVLMTDVHPPLSHPAGTPADGVYGPDLGDYAAVAPGDPIVVIGSPLGLEQTVTQGIVSAKRSANGLSRLQLSAGISAGSSGSPVFNDRGQVIGIVVSTLTDGQQLNFAVGADSVKASAGVPLSVVYGGRGDHRAMTDADRLNAIQNRLPASPAGSTADVQSVFGLRDIAINVKFDSEQHEGVDADDVEAWVGAEILRSAPGLRLTHLPADPGTMATMLAPSLVDTLTKFDDQYRNLLVRVYSPPDVGAELDVVRAAVTPGGIITIVVYEASDWAPAGSQDFAGDARRCVQKDVADFAGLWMAVNHPGSALAPEPLSPSGATLPATSTLPPPPPARSP